MKREGQEPVFCQGVWFARGTRAFGVSTCGAQPNTSAIAEDRFGEPRVPEDTLRSVPDVMGETVGDATPDQKDEGFLVQLEQRDGNAIDPTRCTSAKVVEQDPASGAEVVRATTVTITVDGCPA